VRFRLIAGIAALALLVGYFGPIVVKLKEIPLIVVIVCGLALVVVDFWESLRERDG